MKLPKSRSVGRAVVVALLATVPVTGLAGPASAEVTRKLLTYSCSGMTPIGTVNGYAYQDVTAEAPEIVAAGDEMSVVLTPTRNVLPEHVYNRVLDSISDITFRIPVPSDSHYLGHSLSGGFGYTGGVTVYQESRRTLAMRVPGRIRGGAAFQLPEVTLRLRAGSQGTVRTTLDGSSQRPQLTFSARVRGQSGLAATVFTRCRPQPNVVLTSTSITRRPWPGNP